MTGVQTCALPILFVTNQNNANGVRGNHPLDEVVSVTSSFLEGKFGLNAAGDQVYEPRESHKGNAARALLYMALKYHGINGMDWSFNHLNQSILPSQNESPQSLSVLLQWNAADPPDAEEISRNDYIQSIQQNRNPFIDHPWWVSYVDFNSMQYQNGTGLYDNPAEEKAQLSVYPSPT